MRRLGLLTGVVVLLLLPPSPARAEFVIQGGGGGSFSSICSGSSDTQVLFNDGGTTCAGDSALVWNKTTDTLGVGNISLTTLMTFPNGSQAAPSIRTATDADTGFSYSNAQGTLAMCTDTAACIAVNFNNQVRMTSGAQFGWTSSTTDVISTTLDTFMTREANDIVQFDADAAAPAAYLVKGADARAGTDSNTAGANITLASGRGTGTGAVTSLILQTPTVAGAGTGAQALADRLTLNSTGGVFTGTITSSRTTDVGWAVVAGADTACNTTCTFGCAFGWNLTAGNITGTLLACTDATADACLCIGAN